MTFVPGIGASAGAAAAVQRMQKEEEEMTPYTRDDLAEGWEFKILRSMTNGFKDRERLRKVLAEEARAGWTLVEKFDDARLRLKRPATAKESDTMIDFDPYRTWVGVSQGRYITIVLFVALGIPLLIAAVLFLIVGSQ